jgi:hypothetical protein
MFWTSGIKHILAFWQFAEVNGDSNNRLGALVTIRSETSAGVLKIRLFLPRAAAELEGSADIRKECG